MMGLKESYEYNVSFVVKGEHDAALQNDLDHDSMVQIRFDNANILCKLWNINTCAFILMLTRCQAFITHRQISICKSFLVEGVTYLEDGWRFVSKRT